MHRLILGKSCASWNAFVVQYRRSAAVNALNLSDLSRQSLQRQGKIAALYSYTII